MSATIKKHCFVVETLLDDSSNTISSREIERTKLARNDDERPLVGNHGKHLFTDDTIEQTEETKEENVDFPRDLFTSEQRRYGAVVLHAFLGFYCFVLIAFVCDDYLLPSLYRICKGMKISSDIAGATFLAMASAFPEMFVNVIGTFLTKSDLGVGTVVGSAVFDTFATPACGALVTLHAIPLQWQVLSRDCIVYVISVGTLVIVMWDGLIKWYEATILLILFFLYVALLFGGKYIVHIFSDRRTGSIVRLSSDLENSSPVGSYRLFARNGLSVSCIDTVNIDGQEWHQNGLNGTEKARKSNAFEEDGELENPFEWPLDRNIFWKCWFVLTWPLKFLLFITVPDARRHGLRKWYPLTFVMCVIWIAIASYLLSWMMTVVGDTIGIPDSIMGLTFLAAGGNIPELATIVILARQGDGNMAMSNTLGANILDILLCLGLPWTIKCLVTGRDVVIVSGALSYSVLSLVICIIVLFSVIAFFKFKLNKNVGIICLLLYIIFIVFALLAELKILFS
ncbi:sodium/potassium/calcium exchanger 3 [Ptiloglossa arizonensis]|uniref:sodium/potassium/calcium exchanger 3 n=1 Tax=Ptiloglossa arizonensis TaxID=3350558 RepID=UPI003F9EF77A